MIDFFNKPYPYTSRRNYWKQALAIGFFVFLFLFIFQPFGLAALPNSKAVLTTFIYGLITFSITFLFGRILPAIWPAIYNEDDWKVYHEVLHILCLILCIGVANYFFTTWMCFIPFDLKGFLRIVFSTLALGSIVIIGMVGLETNRALKKHLQEAQAMNIQLAKKIATKLEPSEVPLTLESEVEKQSLRVLPSKLIYLSSVGNYIECFYLNESNTLVSAKIRNRLKVIEAALRSSPDFFRCHRAFIINKQYIQAVEGNAKGYNLSLSSIETSIPVARSKSAELKTILA